MTHPRYKPAITPIKPTDIPRYLDRELRKIAETLNAIDDSTPTPAPAPTPAPSPAPTPAPTPAPAPAATVVLDGSTTSNQTCSGTGSANAIQVTFGSAQYTGSDPVMLSAAGAVTFNTAGLYRVVVELNVRKTGSTTSSGQTYARALLNGSQISGLLGWYEYAGATTYWNNDFELYVNASASDVLTIEFAVGNVALSLGSLSLSGWTASNSAKIVVVKL